MITSQDAIETFMPSRKPRLIILGTMGSINARAFNGKRPQDVFFYNNNRNHFWKVLQLVFEPRVKPKVLTVGEKRSFLNAWRIGMANVVHEIKINSREADDPSDEILFRANRDGRLKLKLVEEEFRAALRVTPVFFTCRQKKDITRLLYEYAELNGLEAKFNEKIWYLPTPTRCSPQKRSLVWKEEIERHTRAICGKSIFTY